MNNTNDKKEPLVNDHKKTNMLPFELIEKLNTYERYQHRVKEDLDRYAAMIKENDLKADRLREKIISKVNSNYFMDNDASDTDRVSDEKLKKLSQNITRITSSLDYLNQDESKFNKICAEINNLKNEFDRLDVGKVDTLNDLPKTLNHQNAKLTHQTPPALLNKENYEETDQMNQLKNLRQSLKEQLFSLLQKVSEVKERLKIGVNKFDLYRENGNNFFDKKPEVPLRNNSSVSPIQPASELNTKLNGSLDQNISSSKITPDNFSRHDEAAFSSLLKNTQDSAVERGNVEQSIFATKKVPRNKLDLKQELAFSQNFSADSGKGTTLFSSTEKQNLFSTKNTKLAFSPKDATTLYPDFLKDIPEVTTNLPTGNQTNLDTCVLVKKPFKNTGILSLKEAHEESSKSNANCELVRTLDNNLNLCKYLVGNLLISKDAEEYVSHELDDMSKYFWNAIAELQNKNEVLSSFKDNVLKLISQKCTSLVNFSSMNQPVDIKKEYDSFIYFSNEFNEWVSSIRKQIFTHLDLFNSFTEHLEGIFKQIKKQRLLDDSFFCINCGELFENCSNLCETYNQLIEQINSVDFTLKNALQEIKDKFDSIVMNLRKTSHRTETFVEENNLLIRDWNKIAEKIVFLFNTLNLSNGLILTHLQALNISFEDLIRNEKTYDSNEIIKRIDRELKFFNTLKMNFENQISNFDFHFTKMKSFYGQFTAKKQLVTNLSNELMAKINDNDLSQRAFVNWIKQKKVMFANSHDSLKIQTQKMFIKQKLLFSLYASFTDKYPVFKNHLWNFYKNQKLEDVVISMHDNFFKTPQNFLENQVKYNDIQADSENVSVLQELRKKTELLIEKIKQHNRGNL